MIALVEASLAPNYFYEVALVASDNPSAAGLAWAREHGLPTFALSPKGIGKAAYEAALDRALRHAHIEVLVLAGYMRLLSDGFVSAWRGRIVNIHPSLLPKYKGLDTHARAIAAGDTVAGCSVHLVTEELDGGTVLGQAEVPILPGDDAKALAARVLVAEHGLYPQILTEFVQTMTDQSPLAAPLLDRVRAVALQLPGASERPSHGQPTFFVEDRQFAQVRDDQHGDGRNVVCVRTSGDDEQAMLLEADPATYSRPAYLASKGWVAVALDGDVDWTLVEDRIARSWELAAPQGLLEAGGR